MKTIANAFAVLIFASATAVAQADDKTAEEGFSLLEEGAKIILRSMMDEVEPTLKELQEEFGGALSQMGPMLKDMAEMIGDIRNYEAPEQLPNGDIILRRKRAFGPQLPVPGNDIEI
ncbi:MAG: hypothetical protein WBC68_16695 [Albidovulum sp.]